MNTNSKFLQKIEIEPGIFELTFQAIHSGACQCYGDCDCYKNKGKILNTFKKYSNELVLKPNGKVRLYNDLKGCKLSLEAFLKKHDSNNQSFTLHWKS